MEAVNTAIEEIIDRISPEVSDTGKHAKDLGSLAVFCLILANSLLLLYALSIHFSM
jgi:diacylglycerol kinase (ATP)